MKQHSIEWSSGDTKVRKITVVITKNNFDMENGLTIF